MVTTHSVDASCSRERLRANEPYLFFAGVVLAVAAAIALVTWEANCVPIGPQAAADAAS